MKKLQFKDNQTGCVSFTAILSKDPEHPRSPVQLKLSQPGDVQQDAIDLSKAEARRLGRWLLKVAEVAK